MLSSVRRFRRRFFDAAQYHFKRWLKPNTLSLAGGATADLTRSKADLVAENALLRQQLIILKRQSRRPQLDNFDRIKLLLLARATPFLEARSAHCPTRYPSALAPGALPFHLATKVETTLIRSQDFGRNHFSDP